MRPARAAQNGWSTSSKQGSRPGRRTHVSWRASKRHSVPHHAESCHTALVAGYVVEGHVPASDIQRLLRARPAITGLAVPGMPTGSPGMEVPGTMAQPYDVIAFEKNGDTQVFARHGR